MSTGTRVERAKAERQIAGERNTEVHAGPRDVVREPKATEVVAGVHSDVHHAVKSGAASGFTTFLLLTAGVPAKVVKLVQAVNASIVFRTGFLIDFSFMLLVFGWF